MTDSEPVVEVNDLVRRFGDTTAVDGLSFRVRRGELLALLGPNGAGKSTTLQTLEGFARPDSGTVRVLGLDPWTQSAALRPRMGVMLQAGGAHGAARAGEMLELIAACSAEPLDTGWLLATLGLTDAARTPVRRLSGGQVQRLGLAMALVGRPEVLVLDEPTAGMDPQARRLVWDLIRAAKADGVTVLLTTHLLDEAELLADRVLIVDHGRAVAYGTPGELTAGEGEKLRFRAAPGLDLGPLRQALPESFTVTEPASGSYLITGQISPATAATVTSFCARLGVMPSGLDTGGQSLEELYLELTGRQVR